MKAGSLQSDDNAVRLRSAERRHPQEKCASKCVRGIVSLCLHLVFYHKVVSFVLCILSFAL